MFDRRESEYQFEFPFKVFINEADNDPASQAVDIALTYIKKNPSLGMSVQILTVEGNRTDSRKFLESSMSLIILYFHICAPNKISKILLLSSIIKY